MSRGDREVSDNGEADELQTDAERATTAWKAVFLKFVLAEYLMVPLALLLVWIFKLPHAHSVWRQFVGTSHWSWGLAVGLFATVPLLLTMGITEWARWKPIQDLHELVMLRIIPLFRGMPWWALLLIAAGAGLGEEWLFRGFGLQLLISFFPVSWNPDLVSLIAIVLIALIFGAFHAMSRVYFIATFLIGIYFGYLVQLSGSLLPAVVSHGLYDFLALVYLMRLDRNRQPGLQNAESSGTHKKNAPSDVQSEGA